MNHELTDTYRHALLEPLHRGRPETIDWSHPAMAAILPDLELPNKMRAEKAAHYHFQQTANLAPLHAEMAGMRADIAHLRGTNQRMADRPDTIPLGDGRYMEKTENGSIKVVRVGG
jgi:hypothetical protein